MINKFVNIKADAIVEDHYKKTKNKNPFTQSAEIANDLLSYKVKDGHLENKDGKRITNAKEANTANDVLAKNLKDQKTDDYLKEKKELKDMVAFGIRNSSEPVVKNSVMRAALEPKHTPRYLYDPAKEKLEDVNDPNWDYSNKLEKSIPILQNNINHRASKPAPVKSNPTVNKYRAFRENQKKESEDKKFNDQYEKEYGDQAIKNYVRAKVMKNRKQGKEDYENLSMNDIIVNEHTKDEAKKQIAIYKNTKPLPLPGIDIDIPLETDPPKMPDFKTFMQSVAPTRDPDLDAGIAGLDEIQKFKNTIEMTNQKFPKEARGIGPFLSGEEDNDR